MITFIAFRRVRKWHIDKGMHANFALQLLIASSVLAEFRKKNKIGLEMLRSKHGMFLVMGEILGVKYRKQLRFNDLLKVQLDMEIDGPCSLKCNSKFFLGEELATEMSWLMVNISVSNDKPMRIPTWMRALFQQPVPPTT